MAGEKQPGQGHRARLRDKFLEHGLVKFTDEEVLELLLTLATPRRDCKQQARALYREFGGLAGVLEASPGELGRIKGVGPVNILGLKLVPAVARRYLEDRLAHGQRYDLKSAADYLAMTMRHLEREVFRVLLLDVDLRVIAVEEISQGTTDHAVIYPREVAARALAAGASAVVCAHNHPSGDPAPSADDLGHTRQTYFACASVGVDMLDHVIVGREEIHSMADDGVMQSLADEYRAMALS